MALSVILRIPDTMTEKVTGAINKERTGKECWNKDKERRNLDLTASLKVLHNEYRQR